MTKKSTTLKTAAAALILGIGLTGCISDDDSSAQGNLSPREPAVSQVSLSEQDNWSEGYIGFSVLLQSTWDSLSYYDQVTICDGVSVAPSLMLTSFEEGWGERLNSEQVQAFEDFYRDVC